VYGNSAGKFSSCYVCLQPSMLLKHACVSRICICCRMSCSMLAGAELDEKQEAESEWIGHTPITRAKQFFQIQQSLRSTGVSACGASAVAAVFKARGTKTHNPEGQCSQFLITTHLRILGRYCPVSGSGDPHDAPVTWIELLEGECGRRTPFDSIYTLDNLQKACRHDGDLTCVVPFSQGCCFCVEENADTHHESHVSSWDWGYGDRAWVGEHDREMENVCGEYGACCYRVLSVDLLAGPKHMGGSGEKISE